MDDQETQALLATLLEQERTLQFNRFSNEDALQLGLQMIAAVRGRGKAAAVSIVRCGQQLFQHAMAGTTPDNAEWIRRKENVVLRFGHSSYYMGVHCRSIGTTFEAHTGLGPTDFMAHGGCFPIILAGTGIVGTMTASGLPQEEDHAIVTDAVRAHLREARG